MNRVNLFFILMACVQMLQAQDTLRVRLLFAGDIMQHDSQILAALQADEIGYSYQECFKYIKPLVSSADIAIANLELTLAGPPHKGYPQFSAPDELASDLKDAGFDVLVTANNHSLDRRKKGLERTIDILDSLQLSHTGTFKDSVSRAFHYPLLLESKGLKFSLLNYTYGTNGIPVSSPNVVNLLDTLVIKNDLQKAIGQQADMIIAFVHWGTEYQDFPNQQQIALTQFFFDHGANLVIGSHPHVLQPMQRNGDQLVAYSLGNFVSGQQSRYRDGGAMLWVDVQKIHLPDSAGIVRIADVSYDLVWVYRNTEKPKKYFILPAKEFESDTVILKDTSLANFKIFLSDARKLLTKNKDVHETTRDLLETSYFKVHVGPVPSTWQPDSSSLVKFYGLVHENLTDSLSVWSTQRFYDVDVVQQACRDIQRQTDQEAKVIWYYWDQKIPLPPGKDDTN